MRRRTIPEESWTRWTGRSPDFSARLPLFDYFPLSVTSERMGNPRTFSVVAPADLVTESLATFSNPNSDVEEEKEKRRKRKISSDCSWADIPKNNTSLWQFDELRGGIVFVIIRQKTRATHTTTREKPINRFGRVIKRIFRSFVDKQISTILVRHRRVCQKIAQSIEGEGDCLLGSGAALALKIVAETV